MIGRFIYLRLKEFILRKRKQQQKLNEVRTRIAYEMHQDIGNDLTALIYKIRNLDAKNANAGSFEFKQLEQSTYQVITKVNDIVWSLNAEKNNLKDLQNHLLKYAEQTLNNANIKCTLKQAINLPGRRIETETRKNIYLLFKESINNIIKHSKASNVDIILTYKFRKLIVSIADNGKGFDMQKIVKGNGIEGMQYRIKLLKGKVEFLQNQPHGTLIKFEMNI
jgi:signal transduction histidine kinase